MKQLADDIGSDKKKNLLVAIKKDLELFKSCDPTWTKQYGYLIQMVEALSQSLFIQDGKKEPGAYGVPGVSSPRR